MSKALLEGYKKRKDIIAMHQAVLDGDMTTSDTVTGSMAYPPYAEHVITITGRDEKHEQWLRQRICALEGLCTKAEAYVASVEDEQMRSLLYWHYIQGLSWPKVRKRLRMREVTADCLRIRAERFFNKQLSSGTTTE